MATVNTPISVGNRREVPLQAPGTAVAVANTLQWDLSSLPADTDGVVLVINVTATGTSPSVTPTIFGYDATTGTTWPLIVGAPITATGVYVFKVHDSLTGDLTAGVGKVANDVVGQNIRIQMAHGSAVSVTYSATAELV